MLLSAPIQIRAAQARTPERLREARSQRKDDWLAMVVMVLALLSDSYPLTGWAYLQIREAMGQQAGQTTDLAGWIHVVGAVTLAWLVQRSVRRLGTPSHR